MLEKWTIALSGIHVATFACTIKTRRFSTIFVGICAVRISTGLVMESTNLLFEANQEAF